MSNSTMTKFNMTGVSRKTKDGIEAKESFKKKKLCAAVVGKLQWTFHLSSVVRGEDLYVPFSPSIPVGLESQ